jgi:flagellar hook-length control protein FliK
MTNASIKLSPPDLGPLEIRIALSAGQANIAFTTHSQVTREALEAAAPQLRSALGAQGFASVNVDVSQQPFRERNPQSTPYEAEFSFAASAAPTPAAVGGKPRLDAYA